MVQVVCGVLKWCWSRLQGGVVGWDAYELFKVGESGMADHLDTCGFQGLNEPA